MHRFDSNVPSDIRYPLLTPLLGVHLAVPRSRTRRMLVGAVVALVAGQATLALGTLCERNIFMLIFLAVALAGLYGGFGGSLAALLVGTAFCAYALFPPTGSFALPVVPDWIRLAAFLATGLVIGLLCETLRRTLRRLIERDTALRESVESYRTLFHTLTEMVFLLDFEGRLITVNTAAERSLGFTGEELFGQVPMSLVDPERNDLAELRTIVGRALAGEPQLFEAWVRRRDGSCFPLEVTIARGRYFSGEVLIAVGRDISRRKAAEAALARSAEELRQAQKMEAIGRLAGGVAHDFNNLLTAIRGIADLALTALPDDSPAARDLREISATADRATSLTRQLLAFSRKQVCQPRVLDLNQVLAELERTLLHLIGSDVELRVDPAPAPACIHADMAQLEQVILNLVVNARDALPQGGHIRLGVELADATVMLTVRDDGCGIPPDVRERIFEPFFTTKPPGQGTGLGLSTVYGIVRQAGGDIEVESEPGVGTCFRIRLPRVAGEPVAAPPVAQELGPAGTGTVLLVEDDVAVRSLIGRILRRGGYQVLSAASGEEALTLLREGTSPPDLLLTDVVMPGLSGPELVQRIQQRLPGLPVLFISGHAIDAPDFARHVDPGAVLLEKPFTAKALLGCVAHGLAGRHHATGSVYGRSPIAMAASSSP